MNEDVAAALDGIGGDLRILKAGPAGIFAMNDRFHRIMVAGRDTLLGYAIGEPIMFLKNDYQRGLRNGSLGTVTGFDGGLVCEFDGQEHHFGQSDMADIMLAYAIYTAVTRGTEQVVLVGDAGVLAKAVVNPPLASRRRTGLLTHLSSSS